MSELLNGTEARLICAGSTLELEDGVGPSQRISCSTAQTGKGAA
jgi:hypothetical protein